MNFHNTTLNSILSKRISGLIVAIGGVIAMSIFSINAQKNVKSFEGLLADQIKLNMQKVKADSIAALTDTEDEGDLFETNELYEGVWSNRYVNPYGRAGVELPDSFRVNCSNWAMPTMGRVTSNYGMRKRRFHYGIDLKLQTGDPVLSAFDGVIRVTAYEKGYGNFIVVRHNNGFETVYGHLSRIKVSEGDEVKAGAEIGLGGNTGRSFGAHLHFEVRLLGQAINPSDIFDFEYKVAHRDYYMFYAHHSKRNNHLVSKGSHKQSPNLPYHKVRKGDSLSTISQKYGVPIAKLCSINRIPKNKILNLGQIIRLS